MFPEAEAWKESESKALALVGEEEGWRGRRVGKSAKPSLFGHCAPEVAVATWLCLAGRTCACWATNFPEPHSTAPIFSSALMGHVCRVLPNHKNNHTLVAGGGSAWLPDQAGLPGHAPSLRPDAGPTCTSARWGERFQGELRPWQSFLWSQDAAAEQAINYQRPGGAL